MASLLLQLYLLQNAVPKTSPNAAEGYPIFRINSGERLSLSDSNFTQNSGSVLLHINGYNFRKPLENITLLRNHASGILLQAATPKFEGDGVEIRGLHAEGNTLQSPYSLSKPPVGVLAFRGLSTATGETVNVNISNSTIRDNWFEAGSEQKVRQGLGL